MEMDRTSLICISTVLSSDNFYSKLLGLKDERGRDFFKKFEFYLACRACMDAGTASTCTHKMEELPHWQSARKHKRIREMMSDQQELLQRETMGIMQDSNEKAFRSVSITRFVNAPRCKPDYPVPYVFVAIDPNGGGDSRFAMVSAYYRAGKMVVIGMEAIKAHKPSDYEEVLIGHVREILLTRQFRNARVVLMPEANLGFEAHHIERVLMKSECGSACMCMRDDAQPGLRTTHAVKEAMHVKFNDALEDDGVVLMDDLICIGGSAKKIVRDLRDELTTYACVVDNGASVFSQAKKTYTGKVGGFQDDLCICIQLNMLWHSSFFKEPKYRTYHV